MSLLDIEHRASDHRPPRDRRPARGAAPGKKLDSEATAILARGARQPAAPRSRGGSPRSPAAAGPRPQATAFLHDQIVRLAYDFVTRAADRRSRSTSGSRWSALGGTGRGEMAPFSDLDLMFLTAEAPTAEPERAVEAMLYLLWDLKLKVGHSVRSVDELIALAKKRHDDPHRLPRGALAVGRREAVRRGHAPLPQGGGRRHAPPNSSPPSSPSATQRHVRMGDSRYVVEPNVKDGKGGLRDLHTLYWIGKYVHGVERPADLVEAGLLTAAEFRRFDRAERFFWAVRCHLHCSPDAPRSG